MFLFSSILLREFKFAIDFIDLFHALPCKWNNSTGLIDYVDSSSDKCCFPCWKFINSVMLLHGVFFSIGYFRELVEFRINKFGDFMVATTLFIIFALSTFLQFFVLIKGKPLITCCNRFLKYYISLQGEAVCQESRIS